MSRLPAWQECLDFVGRPIVVGPSHGQLSGDAGLLPVRQFDQRIGLTPAFANALDDPRDPDLTEHTFLEMVRSRVYGILAGYADQNDHDTLRADPVFKLLADRSPEDDDLAGQPTLSRFENAISIPSLKRLCGPRGDGPAARPVARPVTGAPGGVKERRSVARTVPGGSPTWRRRSRSRGRCGGPWRNWARAPGRWLSRRSSGTGSAWTSRRT